MCPLHHYCKSLSGQYDDDDDDFERHLGMDTPSKPRAPPAEKAPRPPGGPVFFRDATAEACTKDAGRWYVPRIKT